MIVDSLINIINYHTGGQTAETIIDYHKKFEQAHNK